MLTRLSRAAFFSCLILLAACDPGATDDPNAVLNISASITGLQGKLVLFQSGVGVLGITGSGNVDIATHVVAGSPYNFTIAHQPYGQTCVIANGSGIATSEMNTVLITCGTATYPVAFNVSGLAGEMVLKNFGADPVTVTADGNYAFPTLASHGDAYNVAISTEPVGHSCSVINGSGDATGEITGMQVQCVAVDPMMIREVAITTTAPKFLRIEWQPVPDATYYRLTRDIDGIPGGSRAQVGGNTTNLSAMDRVAVHLMTRYIYVVEACDAVHCVASVPADTDGMLTQAVGYLKADWSDGGYNGHYFGWRTALSSDGQTLAVGSTGLGAYVFVRPATYWKQQARIALNPPGSSDPMGLAVALSANGNTLAVTENYGRGRVRIYGRNLGIINEQAVVNAPGTEGASFGQSVALSADGNTLVVGDSGVRKLFLFVRQGTAWTASSIITGPNTAAGFGNSVAISGDSSTIAVGAPGEEAVSTGVNGSLGMNGAAYVYVRTGATWAQQAHLTPSAISIYSGFGASVSLSANGNVVAIGVPGDASARTGINQPNDRHSLYRSGSAYVFARSGTTWAQNAYLKAYVTDANDDFGHSVSLSADGRTLAVGAPHEDSRGHDLEAGMSVDDSSIDSGAAYIFTRPATTWRQHRYIKAPVNDPGDYFGYSVALSADAATLAVGAVYESSDSTGINGPQGNNAAQYSGATYLY